MKIILIIIISCLSISNTLKASENFTYENNNIIGVSFSMSNDSLKYIELRDQICFIITDFPIIPFVEPNIYFGLTNNKPNYFSSILFGFKKGIIEKQDIILSFDLGTGIAIGIDDKENAGVIGRIGFDICYKSFILRCLDLNLISGFNYKGTVSIGVAYSF